MKKFYELLEIEETSTQTEIKRAYRRMAKKYHPDLNPGNEEVHEKFKEINAAYEVLSDEEKRRQYDRFGDDLFKNGNMNQGFGGGFSDIFRDFGDISDIFGDLFGQNRHYNYQSSNAKNTQRKGGDLEYPIQLTFMEAVFGVEKEVKIQRLVNCHVCQGSGAKPGTNKKICDECHGSGQVQYTTQSMFGTYIRTGVCEKCRGLGEIIEENCEHCKGTGREKENKVIKVKIPAGIDTGMVLTVKGEGNEGINGGANGDLFVIINVEEHEFFKRNGSDIYFEMPITFPQAALGSDIEIPTLDGTEKFEIPAGTQSETQFTLKNKGVPHIRFSGRGDLHFIVKIIVPKKLQDKQRELLNEFAKLTDQNFKPKSNKKGIFDRIKDMFE